MENWKDIPGYVGLYQASTLGNIRSTPGKTTSSARFSKRVWKTRILKPKCAISNDYRHDLRVSLWKNGNVKDWLVARLVALTWVDGYSDGMTVNHINGDYLDNRPENLEWVTLAQNIRHAYSAGLMGATMRRITISDGEFTYSFASLADASRFLGRNVSYISNGLKLNRKISGCDRITYSVVELSEKGEQP